jgi:hypothetical protein
MISEHQPSPEESSRPYGLLVVGTQLPSEAELLQLAVVCAILSTSRGKVTMYRSVSHRAGLNYIVRSAVAKQPIRDAATKAVAEHPRCERVACIPAIFARFVQYEFVFSTRSRKWIQKYDRVGS